MAYIGRLFWVDAHEKAYVPAERSRPPWRFLGHEGGLKGSRKGPRGADAWRSVRRIFREFLVESTENLDRLNRDFVALESSPGAIDCVAAIFRTIHTIKGTSGFLGLSKLEDLAHGGEGVLSKIRDGKLTLTPEIAQTLWRW